MACCDSCGRRRPTGPSEFIHVTDENALIMPAPGDTIVVDGFGHLPNNFQAGPKSIVQILNGTIGDRFKASKRW